MQSVICQSLFKYTFLVSLISLSIGKILVIRLFSSSGNCRSSSSVVCKITVSSDWADSEVGPVPSVIRCRSWRNAKIHWLSFFIFFTLARSFSCCRTV